MRWHPCSNSGTSTSWPREAGLGRRCWGGQGEGITEVDQGRGRQTHGQPSLGRGMGLVDLGCIQTPILDPVDLVWATRICISYFTSANPSGPIGVSAVHHGVREINSPTLGCAAASSNSTLDMWQTSWPGSAG